MSKILNRPMFRGGGKVSSYGNGIATGLADGYEKGGSVQDRPGYFYGGQILKGLGGAAMKYGLRPAAKYGMKGMDYLFNPSKEGLKKYISSPGNTKDYLSAVGTGRVGQGISRAGQGIKSLYNSKLNPFNDPLVGGVAKVPFGAAKLVGKGVQKSPYGAAALGGDYIYNDRTYLGDVKDYISEMASPVYDKFFPEEYDSEKIIKNSGAIPEASATQSYEEQIEKDKAKLKKLQGQDSIDTPKLTNKEKMAKNKEMFEELMDVDGARIEDASNMALNFAGKALKEGATVKSAMGEFFEEEGKRPSKAGQKRDAAAAAVINSYIAGEKSKAEVDLYFAKIAGQSQMARREGDIPFHFQEAGKVAKGYKQMDLAVRNAFSGKIPNKVKTGEDFTITDDMIGEIFIEDEAPYSVFTILEDKTKKTIY